MIVSSETFATDQMGSEYLVTIEDMELNSIKQ